MTGQYADTLSEKYFGFMRFVILTVFTGFIGGILVLIFKKKRYHPMIFSKGSSQEIDVSTLSFIMSRAKYEFAADEVPEILIKTRKDNFILFTNQNVYYELNVAAKILDGRTTIGKLPISQASEILIKNHLTSAEVMMEKELLGTLYNGESPRISRLFKEISKDVRESLHAS
ncbi:hypothetical protein [Rhizobium jaguaris]|uniref:hypothetical protein n=1 Tax=Rhizobium jaguaris TaxID=1312183 RepID=UPI0013C43F35|nr:hypothetical protein [Rhizobium jaguaris]